MEDYNITQIDNDIRNEIINRIAWDSRIDVEDVFVEVEKGVVTLKGTIPSFYQSRIINNEVNNVLGINKIINKLKVNYKKDKRPSDSEIKEDIKRILESDAAIDASNIKVNVNRGVAFIQGFVDAYWKKVEVDTIINRINGILGITNQLAVLLSESKEDKKISEEIIHYIKRNLHAKVDQINVTVKNGEVILAGCVPNWQVYHAIKEHATFTKGVKSVKNALSITPSGC